MSSEVELVSHVVAKHQSRNQGSMPVANNNALSSAMHSLSLNSGGNQHLSSLAAPTSLWQPNPSQFGPQAYGNWNQITKSGQEHTSSQKPRVHVLWPHECVDSILAKRTFNYKDLNFSALVAGSLASLLRII